MFMKSSAKELTLNGLLETLSESLDHEFGGTSTAYAQYRDDPVGFGETILGESYTPDVKKMMESVRDYPITIAKSANATGKTHGAARVAVWFYKCFAEAQIYTAAAPPENNLRKLLWGEIGSIVESHPALFENDRIKNLHVERSAQAFLTGVTIPLSGTAAQRQAKFSGKHAPYLLFVVDEGDAIPDEVFTAIEGCLSGGHGRLLVMFNPRSEAGEVYRMERDGRANIVQLSAFNHPNVISGENQIPGAVTRETTIRRINEWCRPLSKNERPDASCFELPGVLVGAMASNQRGIAYPPLKAGFYKVMEPAFSIMTLGRYPAQAANQLISREWIARARTRWDTYVAEHGENPPKGTSPVLGLDVAEFGADLNCLVARSGGFVAMPVTWAGMDLVSTADRASAEYEARNALHISVDATGVGAGVAPHMQRQGCAAVGVKVASAPTVKTELGEFQILRDQLWWAVREWLRIDEGAMLPPDELLLEELRTPTYEVANGKVRVTKKDIMRELLKRSPDRADALCLSFYEPELLFPQFQRKEHEKL